MPASSAAEIEAKLATTPDGKAILKRLDFLDRNGQLIGGDGLMDLERAVLLAMSQESPHVIEAYSAAGGRISNQTLSSGWPAAVHIISDINNLNPSTLKTFKNIGGELPAADSMHSFGGKSTRFDAILADTLSSVDLNQPYGAVGKALTSYMEVDGQLGPQAKVTLIHNANPNIRDQATKVFRENNALPRLNEMPPVATAATQSPGLKARLGARA